LIFLFSLVTVVSLWFISLFSGEAPAPEEEGQLGLPLGADKEEREAYMQKRMVDFVKRRVLVLEKVLNAEYHYTVSCNPSTIVSFIDVVTFAVSRAQFHCSQILFLINQPCF
jgi:hypothetical protein